MREDLAIVIPVGPGDSAWHGLLPTLALAPAREIVLVLSSDHPGPAVPLAQDRLLLAVSPTGRARQQNAGAQATQAQWLWFLHADSRLAPRTLPALRAFVASGSESVGYFDLAFLDDGPPWMRLNSFGARVRSRLFGLPFGDQGFVLRRDVFERLGGFDEQLASGEDHALVWAARRRGIALQCLGAPLYTSARKYADRGWLRTTFQHLRLTLTQARRFRVVEARR